MPSSHSNPGEKKKEKCSRLILICCSIQMILRQDRNSLRWKIIALNIPAAAFPIKQKNPAEALATWENLSAQLHSQWVFVQNFSGAMVWLHREEGWGDGSKGWSVCFAFGSPEVWSPTLHGHFQEWLLNTMGIAPEKNETKHKGMQKLVRRYIYYELFLRLLGSLFSSVRHPMYSRFWESLLESGDVLHVPSPEFDPQTH